jgi:hypothetical protein
VNPGHDATVRSLPGGEEIVLLDRMLSRSVRRLDLMLARLLDDGITKSLFCEPFSVNRTRRPQMLALLASERIDPFEIAEFFGPQPLPSLRNNEDHELVQCSAAYEAATDDWAALAAMFQQDGPDRYVAERDGLIRGFVNRDGDRWTIETNSLERLRELQDLILSAAPGARLITESSVPVEKALAERSPASPSGSSGPSGPSGPSEPPASPAELERILLDFMVQQEQRWISEPIPALRNLTPRQAVEYGGDVLDDLKALLDDFDWASRRPADMSGKRIRALLGL